MKQLRCGTATIKALSFTRVSSFSLCQNVSMSSSEEDLYDFDAKVSETDDSGKSASSTKVFSQSP
jgi:hypothetical protein